MYHSYNYKRLLLSGLLVTGEPVGWFHPLIPNTDVPLPHFSATRQIITITTIRKRMVQKHN